MPTLVYCSGCGSPMQFDDIQCLHCGGNPWQQVTTSTLTPIPTLAKKKIPCRVLFGLDIDRTDSAIPFRNAITIDTIPRVLRGVATKAAEVRVWIQSHGDHDYGEQEILHADGVSVEDALAELPNIPFAGGGDPRESHLEGLEHLLTTVPFTNNPQLERGVVVSFMTDESKPLRSGKSPTQLGLQFAQAGLLTYLVCEDGHRRITEFAHAANAMVIPISKNPSPDVICDVVTKVSASIVQTLSTGGTVPIDINPTNSDFLFANSATN